MPAWLWALGGFVAGGLVFGLGRWRSAAAPGEAPSAAGALESRIRALGHRERAALERLLRHEHALRDPNEAFQERLTLGQRAADQVAAWGGSWTFIGLFVVFMMIWIYFNSASSSRFDPFPFILLNLLLSCLAALQAPVIMMSQNRQAAKDRHDAHLDYETNLHAELEIQALHAKMDRMNEQQWVELVHMQERQIELLERLLGSKPNQV